MWINKPTIGIFGNFQNGKSTLINCILKDSIAKVGGKGMSVTDVNTRYTYGPRLVKTIKRNETQEIKNNDNYRTFSVSDHVDEIVYQLENNALKEFDLLDTPGIDANDQDTEMAMNAITKCNFAILVLRNKTISQQEKKLAKSLYTNNIPFVVLINCYYDVGIEGSWQATSKHNMQIGKDIMADLKLLGITLFRVKGYPQLLIVNLIWKWISLGITDTDESVGIISAKRLLKGFSLKTLSENSQFSKILMLLNDKKYHRQCYLWKEFYKCNTEINKFMDSMTIADIDKKIESQNHVIPNDSALDIKKFELL